jgi:S1-C subfamily serine protease
MDARTGTTPPTVALEHMTGPARGAVTWLGAPTLDITLDAGCLLHVVESRPGEPSDNLVARLHRMDDTYEVEAPDVNAVWVNGRRTASQKLKHGDTVEFGETGPLCRCRIYTDHSPSRNTVSDIVSDSLAYLRVSRQPPLRRTIRAVGALFARLSRETTMLFRITTLIAIVVFAAVAWHQYRLTSQLQRSFDAEIARLDALSAAMMRAQNEALRPADLTALREEMAERVTSNIARLEELEQRSQASGRVIARSIASVGFLQGAYGFREASGERMLRHMVTPDGAPLISPRGQPLLTLEGDGPIAELQFTGTGFLVGENGALLTNRHVALPWERETGSIAMLAGNLEPVMLKFIVYFPGRDAASPVSLLLASETADLAVLALEDGIETGQGLRLAEKAPAGGDEVIVMGYPTGLRSLLAQSGGKFIEELQKTATTDFWSVAARLAEEGYIAPLASRGIVGQITRAAIVYDAETTHGGSGGPVLDIRGDVLAVNAAILPEYGGSNLGVPIAEVRDLLEQAGLR